MAQLIIALDQSSQEQARALVDELTAAGVRWFKVGLELYTQSGPAFVRHLKDQGASVFLDLKLYDIPNTVAGAVKAAVQTGADLLTVHCSGGPAMLEAAQKSTLGSNLKLLGVTVLTSFGGQDYESVCEAWGARPNAVPPRNAVAISLARLAAESGLPGIVCSVSDLHDGQLQRLSWKVHRPLFVTPGIRESADAANDQKSIGTVDQALAAGATHLVVGRPITAPASDSRVEAAQKFLRTIKEGYVVTSHS
ncbi:MAG: orotidine-5'-phosphate decarboxylase [Bdellovibrionota bacterium]